LQAYEARRGTVVRVREGHWKSQFAGMRGTVQNLWGQSEYAAVDVLLEDVLSCSGSPTWLWWMRTSPFSRWVLCWWGMRAQTGIAGSGCRSGITWNVMQTY
jgi:hypothetical protein